MAETAVVDGQDMRIGLGGEVAICICSPTLSDVAGIAVDFFGTLVSWDGPEVDNWGELVVQFITTLAEGFSVKSLKAVV